ncbi:murein biosynthesis integral membrane protein MurJ [Paenibacillus eucommiae]|uniref:Peptidoglycan lipid II flippase n=1 Tax=Paenibacillus eucommiae TaxID=1355755 RepID=A0ABS4J2A2_9BACL|nr:murein biosynthesis integral membrane protein MurJ [Paenibacillus eucommiae]MBP1993964.1 putative peptidoglycan lipid II flippase [Paenibacillus eucommiae]
MNTKTIFSGAFIIFGGNLLSSLLGLTREILSAAYYGANIEMDAYLFAYTVPAIVLSFVSGIITMGFLPLYIKQRVNSIKSASLFLSNVVNLLMLLLILIIVFCYCFSGPLAAFFAIQPSSRVIIETLLWILLPSILFFALSYVFSSVLNALNHFTVPAFLTAFNNICVIVCIAVLHPYMGIYSVALGFMVGTAFQVLIQVPKLRKLGITYSFRIRIYDQDLKRMLTLSIPIIGLVVIDQCVFLATRFFATLLDAGSASALNYATRIMLLPVALFGTAIVTASYPSTVLMQAENRNKEYNLIVSVCIKSLLLILMPIMFICMAFSSNIIKLLFERGAFDSTATHMTAIAFMILSVGIVATPMKEFMNKLFFSKEMIRTPIHCSILFMITFISSCLILVPFLKYIGIATASSIALLVTLVFQLIKYNALDPDNKIQMEGMFVWKISAASITSTGFSYLLYALCMRLDALQPLWALLTAGCMGLGLLLYLAIIKSLQIKEIDFVVAKLLSKYKFIKRRGTLTNEN